MEFDEKRIREWRKQSKDLEKLSVKNKQMDGKAALPQMSKNCWSCGDIVAILE